MTTQIEPVTAAEIYEGISALKYTVTLFNKHILDKFSKEIRETLSLDRRFHCLKNDGRINVLLAGGFCTGKTTFIKRLIGGWSGRTSGTPNTACLVVHRNAVVPTWEISLKKARIEGYEGFKNFIDDFDGLERHFKNVNDENITPISEDKFTVPAWGGGKDWDFPVNVEKYAGVFEEIVWNHKKTGKNVFLDYVSLYDMPGIGGKDEHDETIEKIFEQQRPDVILYLIDPTDKVLAPEEIETLPKLLKPFMSDKPLFCFVYQKEQEEQPENNNSLNTKKGTLEDSIKRIGDKKVVDYLRLDSFVLDARGDKEDTEIAQNAVSLVLRKHICKITGEYCKKAKQILKKDKESLPAVMDYFPDDYIYSRNPFIDKEIFDKIKADNAHQSMDDARKIISEAFAIELPKKNSADDADSDDKLPVGVPEHNDSNDTNGGDKPSGNVMKIIADVTIKVGSEISKTTAKVGSVISKLPGRIIDRKNSDYENLNDTNIPFDLKETLKDMKKEINKVIGEMCKVIKRPGTEDVDTYIIDHDFWDEHYGKKVEWQRLVFYVQAYHWLKNSYAHIAPPYIVDIGFYILENIKKDIDRLEEKEAPSSVIMKLDDES